LLVERGVPADKIEVVYNWTEEGVFHPLPHDANLERELGLAGRFNVIYAGNFGAFQGLETVIRAAVRLRNSPEIQIVLAGTGQREGELKDLARSLSADNVRFVSHRPFTDMPKINAAADVLLVHLRDLPFFGTTIPGKTQVSLASGRPVLMAVRGDAAAIIERANAGMVVPPEDEAALADAILLFHRMPAEEREAMGRRGREFYLRSMSLDVGGAKLEEIFRAVIDKKSGVTATAPMSG
jgi:glycosyltransferase involved in cell wall biosynthesis